MLHFVKRNASNCLISKCNNEPLVIFPVFSISQHVYIYIYGNISYHKSDEKYRVTRFDRPRFNSLTC